MSPRVTVLVAVYNGGDYLQEAVASVLAQTFADFELLIVDDCSIDGAPAALPHDPRIRVLRNDVNLGQIPSLNRGLREARGELVARLDHDDTCLPRRLERQVALFDELPDVALAGTWVDVVEDDGRLWAHARPKVDSYEEFAAGVVTGSLRLSHPSIMFRRELVIELGGFDEQLSAAEDQELYRGLALAHHEVRVIPETLVRYRRHPGQMTIENASLVDENDAQSHERFLAELAPGLPAHTLRLLLRCDPAVWAAPPLAAAELERFVDLAHARLGLKDRTVLARAVADAVVRAVVAGWASHAPAPASRGLREFAARHGGPAGRALGLLRFAGPAGRRIATTRSGVTRMLRSDQLDATRQIARQSRALRWVYARIVVRSDDS